MTPRPLPRQGCRHDKLLLRRAGAGTSLDSILEELPQHVSGEDLSAPSAHWGDKVGCSIYDEEALLGPYVDMGLEEYYAELAEELIGEEGSTPSARRGIGRVSRGVRGAARPRRSW